MKIITLIFGYSLFINCLYGQSVQSQITLEQNVEVPVSGRSAMKNKVLFYIKDNKAKSESNQQGMAMNVYYNDSTKTMTTVANIAGQKQVMVAKDAINTENKKYDKIEIACKEDSKNIAGIACKKAVLSYKKGDDIESKTVWYNPSIILPFKYNFGVAGLELIKGLPSEYENSQMGFTMKHTVISVDTISIITQDTFTIPKE